MSGFRPLKNLSYYQKAEADIQITEYERQLKSALAERRVRKSFIGRASRIQIEIWENPCCPEQTVQMRSHRSPAAKPGAKAAGQDQS